MKNGWEIKRLPEIAEYFIGLTYSPKDVSDKGIIVLRSSNIQNDELDLSDLVRVARPVKETLKVRDGDILMCSRNGSKRLVGKTTMISSLPEDMTFGTFMTVIRGKHNPYLAWFFKSDAFREQLGVGENTMINQVTKYMLDAIRVPFPLPAEQQRIVGVLDEAFAGIATAQANAEKNLQNARALFESHLQFIFTQRGKGWVDTKLDDVCGFQNGFAFKSSTFKPSGVPILRISNIQDGRIDTDNRLVFFDPKDYRENLDRYRIVKDDLLIAMSGATTGKLGFNTEDTVFYLNQRVGKFEPGKKLNRRFLYHFLSTKVEENLRISAGAAQPNLSTEQIKSFMLPLPDINEQAKIVETLESLSEETQRLANLFERKLAALAALKKSLLHQAFTGNL